MNRLLIKNALIIDPVAETEKKGSILCENGVIADIYYECPPEIPEVQIVEAEGLCAAPGLVDLFSSASEPAGLYDENVISLSHAGVKGGYTTICAHCDINDKKQAEYLNERSRYASCDIIPSARATNGYEPLNYSDFALAGIKAVYDPEGIANPLLMRNAMFRARKYGILLMSRCRDKRLYGEGLMREGETARVYDMPPIPASAEAVVVARDIVLSKESGTHVHMGHISTAESVDLIRRAKSEGADISCSAESLYILLDSRNITGFNTYAKLDPPLGNKSDIDALRKGLEDGTIDCLASGHIPAKKSEKVKSLVTAGFGASTIETALATAITALHHEAKMPLWKIINRMSTAPSRILGLDSGTLEKGRDADIILFDAGEKWMCKSKELISMSSCTPLDGKELIGAVKYTIKSGRIMTEEYDDTSLLDTAL